MYGDTPVRYAAPHPLQTCSSKPHRSFLHLSTRRSSCTCQFLWMERVLSYHIFMAFMIMCSSTSVDEGHLTAKSDVYSYGVVLLEMLTGKRALDKNRPSREQNLVEWAKPYLASKRKIFRIFDPKLEGQYSQDRALKVASIAIRCLSTEPKQRPLMDTVVESLEQLQDSGGENSHERSTNNNLKEHRKKEMVIICNEKGGACEKPRLVSPLPV